MNPTRRSTERLRNMAASPSDAQGAHIALFLPALAGGGAERIMVTLAADLVQKGLQVDLVLTRATGTYQKDVPQGVRIIDLHAPRIIMALPALVRYLRRERPQALLSALSPTNCLAVWARNLAGVKPYLVLCEHNTLSHASKYTRSKRRQLMPHLMRVFYPKADRIVAVSEGVADDLAVTIGFPRERIDVIYNPVVTPGLAQRAQEPLEHPWFKPDAPPVILGVGRLAAAKDFSTLIQAFARLRQVKDARLLILGEGEERPMLEDLVSELGLQNVVSLPGFVENPYKYMSRAEVFTLSSRWEGLPTVLIEAMATGTAVVSSDCPSGPREILENGKWGQLVPVGDPGALAEALERALEAPKLDVCKRAQDFSAQAAGQRYLQALFPDVN